MLNRTPDYPLKVHIHLSENKLFNMPEVMHSYCLSTRIALHFRVVWIFAFNIKPYAHALAVEINIRYDKAESYQN